MSSVQLSNSQNACCLLEPISKGRSYLSCKVKKNSNPLISGRSGIFRGSRPLQCENPQIADDSPMGHCSYKYADLRRCGCPTLDPNKNQQLWNAYVESVKDAVKLRMIQSEITLTIFASGYLLQDCDLLNQLFADKQISTWKGTLNLQYIDLKYEIDKVSEIKRQNGVQIMQVPINWNLMVPAIVLGVSGCVGVVHGLTKKTKVSIIAGIILMTVALIFGWASLKGRKSSTVIQVNNPIIKTMDQFLAEIEKITPLELRTFFFPSTEVCIENGIKSDVIFGYDIDNTLSIFDQLRKAVLKNEGEAITVSKDQTPTGKVTKVMRQAKGPYTDYHLTIF